MGARAIIAEMFNANKLAGLGLRKANNACNIHYAKMKQAIASGDHKKAKLHRDLLRQCTAVSTQLHTKTGVPQNYRHIKH
jgi:hypothetical protein